MTIGVGVDEYDVIVLGTGAAGLTAAIAAAEHGATVGLFEKADVVGGTTAWSGGMVWLPLHPHMDEAGVVDSREDVLTYLESLSFGTIDLDLAAAFVDRGTEMIRFLEACTPVRFRVCRGFPDYHPERPGGKPEGGRSLECPVFSFHELGPWASRVTVGRYLPGPLAMTETPLGRGAPDGVPPEELERRRAHDERGAGLALVGRLLKGCLDRGIEPRTGSRAVELLRDGTRISGVRFDSVDGSFDVAARAGVILATGGFEWDRELVRAFIRGPLDRSVSVPTNTGDGLKMAMRAGASLGNMREAWWLPTADVVDTHGVPMVWMVSSERARPHCIMVNRSGRRFANEAANYNAFGAAFHQIDVTDFDYVNLPSWMIFDHHYLTKYGIAGYKGQGPTPSWLTTAPSFDALAGLLGMAGDALAATVQRFNTFAARGEDPDFGRGRSAHDTWWGDPALTGQVTATLGPLDTPPFYGLQVRSGALGTKGGPRTDVNAQVLDVDGEPIPGLYAAGNVMASVMGMTYGGGGGTLGPAMVFGYLGGRHAALSLAATTTATAVSRG